MPDRTARRRAAVLGHPIEHSLSPVLHRAAWSALGLDWTYDRVDLVGADLPAFLDSLDASWVGLSLTMPLKHDVLPLLDEVAGRDLVPVLGRQADLAAAVADHLRSEAAQLDATDAKALRAAPEVVARVAVREWLRADHVERHPPDAATVERVLAVARGEATATDVGRGRRVERSHGRLRLVPADGPHAVR